MPKMEVTIACPRHDDGTYHGTHRKTFVVARVDRDTAMRCYEQEASPFSEKRECPSPFGIMVVEHSIGNTTTFDTRR